MKSRLSRIILSILILSLALQTFTFPVLARSEANESRAGFINMPLELAERYQRYSKDVDRPEYIPPSPEIIAKTQEQVNSFNCASIIDVPKIECEALVALYGSTNGAGWWENSNWLQSTTVSTWYGVTVTVGSGVTQLNLINNKLDGSILSTLGNLSNLQVLGLGRNYLTGSIPSTLGSLSNLQLFHLFENQLTGSIPAELGNLSNLRELNLYNNSLTGSIPSTLGDLSTLEYLDLSANQLTGSIPLSFVKLTWLYYFNISGTSLCEPATDEFLAWKNTVSNWEGSGLICEDELICLPLIFR